VSACADCDTSLPVVEGRRGRTRRFCDACLRAHRNERERERYADDAGFRRHQLDARRRRYEANVERERERSQTYYEQNRERVLARINAANAARRAISLTARQKGEHAEPAR
jgi:hypothetical protein